jgi:hypothetical protein
MSRKNILILLLIVLSLLVWGRNLYLILFGVMQGDDETEYSVESIQDIPETLTDFSNHAVTFVYQGKHRDPFRHWLTVKKPKPKPVAKKINPKVEKPRPQPPRLRFSGLLEDSTGKLAIVEGPGGNIYFAHENDSVEGVQILQVSEQELQCCFEGEEFILPLTR